jgi:polar amino acid transport system ATP-binding protein
VLQRLVACSRLSGTRVHPLGSRAPEVTAALDPETVKEALVTIRNLAEEGMTCVIVTREMGFAREIADQIYFTDGGVVVEHGPPEGFFTQCRDERARRFLSQIL